jgi:membrane fusion protein (multidrug efflux system)
LKQLLERRSIAVAAGVAILVCAPYWVWHRQSHVSTDDAFVEGRLVVLGARVRGAVQEVLVTDNEDVEEGQVLVRLDPGDHEAQLDAATAAVEVARGQLEAATAGVPLIDSSQRSEERQVRFELEGAADGDLRRARAEQARMRQLVDRRVVSRAEFESAEAALRTTRARVNSIRAALQRTRGRRREVDVSRAELRTARARLAVAVARRRRIERKLQYTTIRAPFRGRVTRKSVEIGQIVQVGEPLLTLVSTEEVWVVANFKENQLADVRPGQAAEVQIDMCPDVVLAGRVASLQAGTGSRFALLPPDNSSGNFVKVVQRIPVKLVFEGLRPADCPLYPGMSVVPTIDLKSKPLPVSDPPPEPARDREAPRLSDRHGRTT